MASVGKSSYNSYSSSAYRLSIYHISVWQLFTSAIVTDDSVRDQFIYAAWLRANFDETPGALTDWYDVNTGAVISGAAGYVYCSNRNLHATRPLTRSAWHSL